MFRRLTLLLLPLSLFVPSLQAQEACTPTIESWGERGISNHFIGRDHYLYAADGRGVAVYDVSEPRLIELVNVTHTRRPSRMLQFAGEDALVVATDEGIELFARNEDGSLRFLDRLTIAATSLATSGSRVAVAEGSNLTIVRIVGNQLSAIRSTRLSNAIDALHWSGDVLYVAEHETAVRVYDTSADQLRQIGIVPVQAYAITGRGNRLYIAGGGVGVITLDVTNPARPLILAVVDSSVGDLRAITIEGSRLFVQSSSKQVRAYQLTAAGDVTMPPVVRDEPSTAILAFRDSLFVSGTLRDRLGFPTETGAPLRALDPATLELRGEFLSRAGGVTGAATDGDYAYVADAPLLRVIDLRTSPPREVASLAYNDDSDRVKIDGRHAIVYGRLEAHIIDISDPLHPRYAGVFHTLGNAPNDVGFSGPYLLEANRASGFHVLDITDPWRPHQLSGLKNDGRGTWFGFASMTGHVYGMMSKGVRVVDIRNPAVATETGFIDTGSLIDVAIVNPDTAEALLVILDLTTLRIFNLANPTAPVEIHQLQIPPSIELTSENHLVHALTKTGVVHIDLRDPRSPVVTVQELNLRNPTQIDAAGKIVIADRYDLRVFEPGAAQSTPPTLQFTRSANGTVGRLAWGGMAGSEYELQLSASPEFSSSQSFLTRGGSMAIALDESRYARIRARLGCSSSAWSEAIAIPAKGENEVVFETGGQIHYAAIDGALPVAIVTVKNQSASAASVQLTSSNPALFGDLPPAFTLGAGERRSVTLPVSEQARSGGRTSLGISGMSGIHVVEVRALSAGGTRTRPLREAIVLPGAGSLAGLNGTRWRSDLQLLCSGGCDFEVGYSASLDPTVEDKLDLSLADGEMVILRDVVALMRRPDTSGTISIYGNGLQRIKAALYTYNDSPAGKFGQRISSRHFDPEKPTPRRSLLLGISSNATSRTNIVLTNLTNGNAFVTLTLRAVDGTEIAAQRYGLTPYATLQIPALSLGTVDEGSVLVDADRGVLASASRVDQKTGDATFSWATPLTESMQRAWPTRVGTFPVAGTIDGAGGSEWKTDIQLANLMDAPARFRLTFLPIAAPQDAIFSEMRLGGGSVLATTPASLFPSLRHGQLGSIRIESDASFTGWSRLYNESANGTYGQYMPLRSSSPSILVSQSVAMRQQPETISTLFPAAEWSEERTNLTLIERGGRHTDVVLAVYDAIGAPLAVTTQHLRPFDTLFINRFLTTLGIDGVEAARIEVTAEGNVDAVGSVVQVRTNDAVTLTTDAE